jgi:hypothetical protein
MPARFRGIGIRIEDDVLVTATGPEVGFSSFRFPVAHKDWSSDSHKLSTEGDTRYRSLDGLTEKLTDALCECAASGEKYSEIGSFTRFLTENSVRDQNMCLTRNCTSYHAGSRMRNDVQNCCVRRSGGETAAGYSSGRQRR